MRRPLGLGVVAALAAAPLVLVASQAGSSVAGMASGQGAPYNPTTEVAGLRRR